MACSTCSCSTSTVASVVPTSTALALNEFSYCGGNLTAQVYIENLDYDKIVTLYYTNADNASTPLDVIQLGYSSSISNTNYELWTSTTPEVNLDGITQLLNITYQATDIGNTYVEQLGLPVVASGPPPTTSVPPTPYATPTGFSQDITNWLEVVHGFQSPLTKKLMFDNIEVTDSSNGSIVAAQSYANPDYGYNWVRDSSLTMDVVASMYGAATNATVKPVYEALFFRYAARRAAEQTDPNLQTGLGEPKFNLDGTVYSGPWGRPQNDGPATAAITMMEFSNAFLAQGGSKATIEENIYNTNLYPNQAPVMKDLLFVAANWSSPSFDLWEEEESDHFYTRMVQHRALVMGSTFATALGDSATASTLSSAASQLADTLPQFYSSIRNLILYEYGPVLRGKYTYKDSAVMLAVIHGYAGDGIYSFSNDEILATAWQIATCFIPIYPIAAKHTDAHGYTLGIPIGRYPEDTYDGTTTTSTGNPWYLCTASMAEVFYRASTEFNATGSITISKTSLPFWQYFAPGVPLAYAKTYHAGSADYEALLGALHGWGDAFMRVIKHYTPADGHLTEEIDHTSGQPVGAIDLTWSYAALLSASFARAEAVGNRAFLRNLANLPAVPNSTFPAAS